MDEFLNLATARRSIRKFTDEPVAEEDLRYFIDSALAAPSGCNSQCWHFVAVRDRTRIEGMAAAVVEETRNFFAPALAAASTPEESGKIAALLEFRSKSTTSFVRAPVVVAVFMTRLRYFEPRITSLFRTMGYEHEAMMERMSWPDVLSLGAAIQNFLLAVEERGYGACWMNEPAIAGTRIREVLHLPEDRRFISIIPVGRPAIIPGPKVCKPLSEVYTEY